jgi:hypothetical protein
MITASCMGRHPFGAIPNPPRPRALPPALSDAANIGRLRSGLLLPQYPDDLFFREPTCLHVHPPAEVMDSTHCWRRSRGSVHLPDATE